MRSVCRNRSRIPQLVDLDARVSGLDPDSLRDKYYSYRAGRRLPELEMAWFIGEALHSLGERWLSGIVTLFAADHLAEFVVMINILAGHVSPARLAKMIASLPKAIEADIPNEPLNFLQTSRFGLEHLAPEIQACYQRSRAAWYEMNVAATNPAHQDRSACRSDLILYDEVHRTLEATSDAIFVEIEPGAYFQSERLVLAYEAATALALPYKRRATHVLYHIFDFAQELQGAASASPTTALEPE